MNHLPNIDPSEQPELESNLVVGNPDYLTQTGSCLTQDEWLVGFNNLLERAELSLPTNDELVFNAVTAHLPTNMYSEAHMVPSILGKCWIAPSRSILISIIQGMTDLDKQAN